MFLANHLDDYQLVKFDVNKDKTKIKAFLEQWHPKNSLNSQKIMINANLALIDHLGKQRFVGKLFSL